MARICDTGPVDAGLIGPTGGLCARRWPTVSQYTGLVAVALEVTAAVDTLTCLGNTRLSRWAGPNLAREGMAIAGVCEYSKASETLGALAA